MSNYLAGNEDDPHRCKSPEEILIEGHRACRGLAPENTLKAFKKAIDLGLDTVEFDIWRTKDNQLVVIHGHKYGDISKSTDGTGNITELTMDEIRKYNAGEGEIIPTFSEVIDLCKGKIFMNIEIKKRQLTDVVGLIWEKILDYDIIDQCSVSSFGKEMLDKMYEFSQGSLELGYLYNKKIPTDWKADPTIFAQGSTINMRIDSLSKELVDFFHSNGKGVLAWVPGNVIESEYYQSILDNGIDAICCDRPDKFKEFVAKIKGEKEELIYIMT